MMTLQQISDRLELEQLTIDYAHAIDRGEVDRLDDIFLPNAEIDCTLTGGIRVKYPEIREWLRHATCAFGNTQHLVTNHQFSVDGDKAIGRILCFNPIEWPDSDAPPARQVVFLALWYHDKYVRTDDGWRIATRTEEPWLNHNVPTGVLPK